MGAVTAVSLRCSATVTAGLSVRAVARLGTTGADIEVGATRRWSPHATGYMGTVVGLQVRAALGREPGMAVWDGVRLVCAALRWAGRCCGALRWEGRCYGALRWGGRCYGALRWEGLEVLVRAALGHSRRTWAC